MSTADRIWSWLDEHIRPFGMKEAVWLSLGIWLLIIGATYKWLWS